MRYWLLRRPPHYTDIHSKYANTPWDYDKVAANVCLKAGDVVYLTAAYDELYGWGHVDKRESYQDSDLQRRAYRVTVTRPVVEQNLLTPDEIKRLPELAALFSNSDLNLVELKAAQVNSFNQLLRSKGVIAPDDMKGENPEPASSLNIKFPRLPLKPGEEIWLNAAYGRLKEGKRLEPRQLFVELLGKIPEDFEHERIDNRLISDQELTLLGILHVDASTEFAEETDRVIRFIRELIIKGTTTVTSEQVSEELALQEERVAVVFSLIRRLGDFWNGVTPHPNFAGYASISFDAIHVVREYLKYKGLEHLLERYNQSAAPSKSYREVSDANMSEREPDFDVCLSFAGEDREYVKRVAAALRDAEVSVFYDGYEEIGLWGKDLYQHLGEVYRTKARYCVIFISAAYAGKLWTRLELKNAQERAFKENREYILPVRFDNTELPGVLNTTKYIDLRLRSPQELADLIMQKIGKRVPVEIAPAAGTQPAVEEAPWKNLKKLASIRDRLSQPLSACEQYHATIERLVKEGKWSYKVGLTYPRELRIAEEQLDAAIRSFGEELRTASTEIDEAFKERVQTSPPILTAILSNELEVVSKALNDAAGAVHGLKDLRPSIRRGISADVLKASQEYQKAVQSLNGIEDAIEDVAEKERAAQAFYEGLVKRNFPKQ